ncbi:MAG: glycosyltransferase family 2 protein [Caulobacteraceae bacterium]
MDTRQAQPGERVSVVIAAYNAEVTIEHAIQTVLDGTYPPLEVIVVDDASKDGTTPVVRRMAEKDGRIRLIESEENRGPARARNVGFRAAKGDWLVIQDSDDAWAPYRLERLVEAAQRRNADIVADNMQLYDFSAEKITGIGFPIERGERDITPLDLFTQDVQLGAEFGYGLLQPLIRKSFLEEHKLSYSEDIRYGEDMLFFGDMLFCGARAVLIPDPGYIYTTRVGEISGLWSPHSKSVPRFDRIADGFGVLKSRYKGQIEPDVLRAINRLERRYRLVHGANEARKLRHEKGMAAYAIHLLQQPGILIQVLRQQSRYWRHRAKKALDRK